MIEFKGGPLTFKADAISTVWDESKCLYWVYRKGDSLFLKKRGSRPPYPESDPYLIGTGYYGTGSVIIWEDGFVNIFWPNIDPDKVAQRYTKASPIPDPSAGAVDKLNPKLRVSEMIRRFGHPITIYPVLIPTYGIERDLDEGLFCERYLNRGARGGHFNAMRWFSFGVWEPGTISRVNFPYVKRGDKFDVSIINPEWITTLKRRIKQAVDRGYTVIITLTDNCSTKERRSGFWNAHPWNGDNNINGTSNWKGSIYHFYEANKQSMPGMPESAQMIEAFIRYVVSELDPMFKPNIIWEICNESQAGEGYHRLIRNWLLDEGVHEDWRVMTSMDPLFYHDHYPFLEFYKKRIHTYLNYACHKINDMDSYVEMGKKWMPRGVKFMASEDGIYPPWKNYRAFVKKILEDGATGFEHNERPYHWGNKFNPDLWDWNKIEEIGDGWKDFLAK